MFRSLSLSMLAALTAACASAAPSAQVGPQASSASIPVAPFATATAEPTAGPTLFSPLPEPIPGTVGAAVPGATTVDTSAPVTSLPPATPTPTPDPAVWRYEGVVVDESGSPIEGVCVVIGPRGCQKYGPHTDDRGVYFFDVPQIPTVVYDLTFVEDGYTAVYHRALPTGPTVFNVVLSKR